MVGISRVSPSFGAPRFLTTEEVAERRRQQAERRAALNGDDTSSNGTGPKARQIVTEPVQDVFDSQYTPVVVEALRTAVEGDWQAEDGGSFRAPARGEGGFPVQVVLKFPDLLNTLEIIPPATGGNPHPLQLTFIVYPGARSRSTVTTRIERSGGTTHVRNTNDEIVALLEQFRQKAAGHFPALREEAPPVEAGQPS